MTTMRAYLPILVGDEEKLDAFLDGFIDLVAWVSADEWDSALRPYGKASQTHGSLGKASIARRVAVDKAIVNQFDREAKIVDFDQIVLNADDDTWLSLDKRYEELGQRALIVVNPIELLTRIEAVANNIVPGYLRMEAGNLHYVETLSPIELRDVYEAPHEQSWRNGVRLALREGGLILREATGQGFDIPPTVRIPVGDLRDICVPAKVEDLVRGQFPEHLLDSGLIGKLKCAQACSKEAGLSFSFAGDVLDVTPTDGWIEKAVEILPDGDWQARTIIETIPESGTTLPRLALRDSSRGLNVTFWSNSVELTCRANSSSESYLRTAALAIAEMLHSLNGKGFGWLSYSSFVELKRIPTGRIHSVFQYGDSRIEDGLFFQCALRQEERLIPDAFGFGEATNVLISSFATGTDPNDKTMWYLPDDVGRFMEAASTCADEYLQAMKVGDPIEQYMQLRRTAGHFGC